MKPKSRKEIERSILTDQNIEDLSALYKEWYGEEWLKEEDHFLSEGE